jgi:hypothetical protein
MKTTIVPIDSIKLNPNNPRVIKDAKFKSLVKSIQDFPVMMKLRPIVVDTDGIILGGNMRYKACVESGMKEVLVVVADELSDAQKLEFIVKDNISGGEWDYDLLKEWDIEQLNDWGIDIPDLYIIPDADELTSEDSKKPPIMKITFASLEQLQLAEIDIIELIDRKYKGAYFSVSAGEL